MEKVKKITYLFGAGASYNSVPILNSLSSEMSLVANRIKEEITLAENRNDGFDYSPYKLTVGAFSEDLIKLSEKSAEYGTIDTYAKKLFLNQEKEELKKLKFLVSIFFPIWQGYFHKYQTLKETDFFPITYSDIDVRYKSLVSNYLIKNNNSFPILDDNVNFVSWNYDTQMEHALSLFFKNQPNLTELNEQIRFLPNNEDFYSGNRILHLNGISNFWVNNDEMMDRIFQVDDLLDIRTIIRHINEIYIPSNFNKSESLINYAWDDNDSKLEEAKRIFYGTDILVIIGYSFPTFNRAIDSELLSGFENTFDKVIYQDPFANEELLELFHINFNDNSIYHKGENLNLKILNDKEVNQFYIPPEYFPQGEVTSP